MAIILPLFVVVHFDDGENATKFVFEAIDGFGSYDTVPEIDECFVRSDAPDDLDGDMLALVHLGSRAMFRIGRSDDRFDWIDKYLLNSGASFVVDVKDIYQL